MWNSLPPLQSQRLILRRLTDGDIDSLYSIFSEPEVMRYWSTPPLENREAAAKLLTDIEIGFAQQRLLKWGVALAASDAVIGTVTLINIDMTHRRAELGYALSRSHWGKGYMQEALHALLLFAFYTLNLHRIEADVDPRNAASIHTLERLGFEREGYLRERWHVGGEIQDALFYGLLRRNWEKLPGPRAAD